MMPRLMIASQVYRLDFGQNEATRVEVCRESGTVDATPLSDFLGTGGRNQSGPVQCPPDVLRSISAGYSGYFFVHPHARPCCWDDRLSAPAFFEL